MLLNSVKTSDKPHFKTFFLGSKGRNFKTDCGNDHEWPHLLKMYYWLSIRLINLDRYVETYSTRAKRFNSVLMYACPLFRVPLQQRSKFMILTALVTIFIAVKFVFVKSRLRSSLIPSQLLLALSSSPGVLGRDQARPSLGSGAPSLRAASSSEPFLWPFPSVQQRQRWQHISVRTQQTRVNSDIRSLHQDQEVLEDQEDWVSDVEQLPVTGDWSGPEHVLAEGHCQCCGLSSGHHYPATRLAPYSL